MTSSPQPPPLTPPTQAGALPPRKPVGYVDRTVRLQVFGALTVMMGALMGCMAVLTPISVLIQKLLPHATPGQSSANWRSAVVAIGFYAGGSVLMIATGIGSIRLRRWVRPIMLVIAWTWLLSGVLTLAMMAASFSQFSDLMAASSQMHAQGQPLPPGLVETMAAAALVSMLLFGVVIPGVLVWAYQSRDVQKTCEARHPEPCWTDKCPLPVLGVSIGLGVGAAFLAVMLVYSVTPAFGVLLTGWPAAAALVVQIAVLVYLTRETYRCTPMGWWGTVALLVLAAASFIITFERVDLLELYRAIGTSEQDLALIREHAVLTSRSFNVWIGVVTVICLGYMLYIRKFFPKRPEVLPLSGSNP